MKKIAVIGSSGGNLYRQGGDNPKAMLKEIKVQAESAGMELAYVQFIGINGSMDGADDTAPAKLYSLVSGEAEVASEGSLIDINREAKSYDEKLADMIKNDQIDAVIILSCDPQNVNNAALTAAAEKKIPIAGTGGTSVAGTQSLGCNVISASGTTGTTNRTRAIAFVSAFAKEWKMKYNPIIGSSGSKVQEGSVWSRINLRGIMMTSLPVLSQWLCVLH